VELLLFFIISEEQCKKLETSQIPLLSQEKLILFPINFQQIPPPLPELLLFSRN
jgi:hypothetical protein